MNLTAKDLLAKGYFPQELPPPFNTKSFADYVDSKHSILEPITKRKVTRPSTHNFSRYGILRRKFSIPNPMNQMNISYCIYNHWSEIQSTFSSNISLSIPALNIGTRAVGPTNSFDSLLEAKARTRAVSRYILGADISRFYHSVYTHSIPWSIHGKVAAKNDHSDNLWGNVLDRLVRNGQDQQTLGIPIGPDTSFIIAEMILCDIEKNMNMPRQTGYRFVDDMELGFKTTFEAQQYMVKLQEGLNDYELALNPTKTRIQELPCNLEKPWAPILRSFNFRSSEKGLRTDLIRYFDLAYDMHRQFPNDAVLSYAISRLRSVGIKSHNIMRLCEDLILQAVIAQPGAIRHALNVLYYFHRAGSVVQKDELCQNLNLIAQHHSNLGHGGEVAWALWGLIEFGLPLDVETVNNIVVSADSICVLLLLDANSRGLISNTGNLDNLVSYMTEDELQRERWLVAYEADIQGWLPSIERKNHVKSHEFFKKLKKAGVSFYNQSATGFPLPRNSPNMAASLIS